MESNPRIYFIAVECPTDNANAAGPTSGTTTFNIMTFCITTFSIMTFCILTFSIMTFSVMTFSMVTFSAMTFSILQ